MHTDIRTTYNEWLHCASAALAKRDRAAAMFCLQQAMGCANKVKGDNRYRSAVLRAMNITRTVEG